MGKIVLILNFHSSHFPVYGYVPDFNPYVSYVVTSRTNQYQNLYLVEIWADLGLFSDLSYLASWRILKETSCAELKGLQEYIIIKGQSVQKRRCYKSCRSHAWAQVRICAKGKYDASTRVTSCSKGHKRKRTITSNTYPPLPLSPADTGTN